MEYVKTNLLSLVILLMFGIFVILFFKGCFQPARQIVTTVIKRDTQYLPQAPVNIPQYQPIIIKSDPANPVIIPAQYQQPSNDLKELTQQVKELASLLYTVNHYRDSIQLKDSSGKDVGVVRLDDAVSQNKIQTRAASYSLRFPVITNTLTVDHPYQPRNQVYIGGGISGNQVDLISAFKAGVLLKNKSDNVLELNVNINRNSGLGGEIGFYKLISFRKK